MRRLPTRRRADDDRVRLRAGPRPGLDVPRRRDDRGGVPGDPGARVGVRGVRREVRVPAAAAVPHRSEVPGGRAHARGTEAAAVSSSRGVAHRGLSSRGGVRYHRIERGAGGGEVPAVRVLIVDDHRIVAEALARMLAQDPAIEVAGLATSGPHALALTRTLSPSLVLMDIGLPPMDGLEATWALRR